MHTAAVYLLSHFNVSLRVQQAAESEHTSATQVSLKVLRRTAGSFAALHVLEAAREAGIHVHNDAVWHSELCFRTVECR